MEANYFYWSIFEDIMRFTLLRGPSTLLMWWCFLSLPSCGFENCWEFERWHGLSSTHISPLCWVNQALDFSRDHFWAARPPARVSLLRGLLVSHGLPCWHLLCNTSVLFWPFSPLHSHPHWPSWRSQDLKESVSPLKISVSLPDQSSALPCISSLAFSKLLPWLWILLPWEKSDLESAVQRQFRINWRGLPWSSRG